MQPGGELAFYGRLALETDFRRLADGSAYTPLPDGWIIGVADIVGSTAHIAAGRYKTVNAAAASVIAALSNALESQDFPFVFGGDGASFAVPAELEPVAAEVMGAIVRFVEDSFHMEIRAALVPIGDIRAAGHDVSVARYAASADVAYAMFTGGGLSFAEKAMKRGAYGVPPGPALPGPDLTGLSCRFSEIPATRGVVLSVIALPNAAAVPGAFEELAAKLIAMVESNPAGGNPLPPGGPRVSWPPAGSKLETLAAAAKSGHRRLSRLRILLRSLGSQLLLRFNLPIGGFDPARYRRELYHNTDFRKFDDGLRMTVDCTPAFADRFERRLLRAEAEGIAHFGTFRQGASLMTCFVPAPTRSDHIHFIDGASGGYAGAASALKTKMN